MPPIEIEPALQPAEWEQRRCGAISVDHVGDEVHIVLQDPDGEIVSISRPEELFALMALANDALPDSDPRKITASQVALLVEITRDMWYGHRAAEQQESLTRLAKSLQALLPSPSPRGA